MKRIDLILLATVVFLTLFGLFMIYDASSFIAFRDFGDKYHYFKDQVVWVTLGFLGLLSFTYFNYRMLYPMALPLLLVAIGLLALVFVPGIGVAALGAKRWINTGFFILQPAEFVKLALAIYLAAWFSTKEKGRLVAFSLLMLLVFLLIVLEPDMGTAAIVLFEALVIYFVSGGSILGLAALVPIIGILGYLFVKLEPYRISRVMTFINPSQSLETSSYHVRQILIALGMGGLTGVGLGNSLQKYAYLPENTTDSIFAIIAEEIGFLGSTVLIILFMVIVWRGFLIASKTQDKFGRLLACGITSFLGIQIIINLAAQTTLIPLTGIPLPFISYGGSSLIVDLCAIGILLNIGSFHQK